MQKIELQCGFIRAFHVSAVSKMSFQMLCGKVAILQLSVFQLGVSIMQLLLCNPRDRFNACCWLADQMNASSKPPSRVRGILPLPLPPAGAVLRLIAQATVEVDGILRTIARAVPGDKERASTEEAVGL